MDVSMLTVEPICGICNRMYTIDGAVALSADSDNPLRVIWSVRRSLGCPFHKLFQTGHLPFDLIERSRLAGNAINEWRQLRRRIGRPAAVLETADIDEMMADNIDFATFVAQKDAHFFTYARFYRPFGAGQLFRPVAAIEDRIAAVSSTFQNCIGVHIRRTDHVSAIKNSPTSLFIEHLNSQIGADPSVQFYLSTDDPETERHLEGLFGDRIIAYKKRSYDRSSMAAIEDALVDLFCLSRSKKILGSFASTFSSMAAELGDIPIEIVAVPDPVHVPS